MVGRRGGGGRTEVRWCGEEGAPPAAGGRRKGRRPSGGWGLGWVMTWMAERPEIGTENKV
jgi:hypothetical protein